MYIYKPIKKPTGIHYLCNTNYLIPIRVMNSLLRLLLLRLLYIRFLLLLLLL